MQKITLTASKREQYGKQVRKLRAEGDVPAVAYGHGTDPIAIQINERQIDKVYKEAGSSRIINLDIDGGTHNAIFQEVQKDPRNGRLIHADFHLVRMNEKIKTEVPLHFVGESTAVYQDGGSLLKNLDTIEIEALPADLPESFEVDIAALDNFEKTIHVADLKVPAGVEILSDAEELIAKVEPPRSEEELAELEEPPTEQMPESEETSGENTSDQADQETNKD